LRDAGRGATIGGGELLDVAPILRASRASPSRSVDRVISERGKVDVGILEQLTGERRAPDIGSLVVDPELLSNEVSRLHGALSAAGPLGLELAGLGEWDRAVLRQLATKGELVLKEGRAISSISAADEALANHYFLRALNASPFAPPDPASARVDRGDLRQLVSAGLVIERDGNYFSAKALCLATSIVSELLNERQDGVTVSQVRQALGCTRRHALPLLAELDVRGVTHRLGNVRVSGPLLTMTGEQA
jgi:selenocysteine-specific elongation factor